MTKQLQRLSPTISTRDCNSQHLKLQQSSPIVILSRYSSNINGVIRAVLNPFFYFFFKKRFCTHQKHKKAQEAQKRNQAKEQKRK